MEIAVITTQLSLLGTLRAALAEDHVACVHFPDAVQLIRSLKKNPFTLVLLDVSDGVSADPTLWQAKSHLSFPPAIVAIANRLQPGDIEVALSVGADDILLVPAIQEELRLRIQFALRRLSAKPETPSFTLECGGCRLDRRTSVAWLDGKPVQLTAREFELAWLLFSRRNSCVSRNEIATLVWGSYQEVASRSLEQHIYKLRQKLSLGSTGDVRLDTVHGQGYRLSQS